MSKRILSAKVIQVIKTSIVIGDGTEENPNRHMYQYWDMDGRLLAEHDTIHDSIEKSYQKQSR